MGDWRAMTWTVGDEVRISRIDFSGRIERIVPTPDPVIVIRAKGGATITMRGSQLERECDDA